MNKNKKKIFTMFICMIFIIATFLSLFLVVGEKNHHCTGEDCPICVCVHQAEQSLKNLGMDFGVFDIFSCLYVNFTYSFVVLLLFLACASLVSRKVRLND